MKAVKLALLLLLLGGPAAADWRLDPPLVAPGGVARLTWQGGEATRLSVRFRGEPLQLLPGPGGPTVLLGVDLEQPDAALPIAATVVDLQGRSVHHGLFLRVERPPRQAARPAERLKLAPDYVTPRTPEQLERIRRERLRLQELYALRSAPSGWPLFRRPLPNPVSSGFGRDRLLNGKTRSLHAGVDFSGMPGEPVAAAAAGRVVFAGELYFTGWTVILDHGDGLFTLYAHLQRLLCREGEELAGGASVGELGSSGRATGPHLHWGARLRGARIDPLALVRLTGGEKR